MSDVTELATEPMPVVSRRLGWGVLGGDSRNAGAPRRDAVISTLLHSNTARLLTLVDAPEAGNVERAHASFHALLDDPDVECVYLAPPVGLERDWVLRAAGAGKHILCAPPLALEESELDEMEAACA